MPDAALDALSAEVAELKAAMDKSLANEEAIRERGHKTNNLIQEMVSLQWQQARHLGLFPEGGPITLVRVLGDATRPTELILAVVELLIALNLILPFDTFGSAAGYRFMAYLPEWLWAIFFAAMGGAGLVALFFGTRRMRLWASGLRFLPWLVVTGLTWAGNPFGWGGIFCLTFFLASGWVLMRKPSP